MEQAPGWELLLRLLLLPLLVRVKPDVCGYQDQGSSLAIAAARGGGGGGGGGGEGEDGEQRRRRIHSDG
jgi:hypothetical protein